MIIKEIDSPIYSDEPIVDVEIKNDISNPNGGDWFYDKSDIVTIGLLYKDKIKVIQYEEDSRLKLSRIVRETLSNFKKIYSFNFRMEKYGIKGCFGIDMDVEEIKPWSGKGWNKDKFFNELKKIRDINIEIYDPLGGDGSLVQNRYKEKKYQEIIDHNINCLIKEAYILKYKNDLIEKFKDNLDNGWIDDKSKITPKQFDYLINLGITPNKNMTKMEASKLISEKVK